MRYFIILNIQISILFSSCASLTHGTNQKIDISTTPHGATISSGEQEITTPGTLELHRGSDHIISISKPGYKTETITMTRKVSETTLGNILLPGGLIGWGIDAASGAQWKVIPDAIDLNLRALQFEERDTAAHTLAVLTELKANNTLIHNIYESLKKVAQKEAYSRSTTINEHHL